jgi:hypothetical protein
VTSILPPPSAFTCCSPGTGQRRHVLLVRQHELVAQAAGQVRTAERARRRDHGVLQHVGRLVGRARLALVAGEQLERHAEQRQLDALRAEFVVDPDLDLHGRTRQLHALDHVGEELLAAQHVDALLADHGDGAVHRRQHVRLERERPILGARLEPARALEPAQALGQQRALGPGGRRRAPFTALLQHDASVRIDLGADLGRATGQRTLEPEAERPRVGALDTLLLGLHPHRRPDAVQRHVQHLGGGDAVPGLEPDVLAPADLAALQQHLHPLGFAGGGARLRGQRRCSGEERGEQQQRELDRSHRGVVRKSRHCAS